jgi:hypothetical protein
MVSVWLSPQAGQVIVAVVLISPGHSICIRRVEYDVDRETETLSACGLPHGDWIVKMLSSLDAAFSSSVRLSDCPLVGMFFPRPFH